MCIYIAVYSFNPGSCTYFMKETLFTSFWAGIVSSYYCDPLTKQPWRCIALSVITSWHFTHADIYCCRTCAGYADSPAIHSHCHHMCTTETLLYCCCSHSWESWWFLVKETKVISATFKTIEGIYPSGRRFSFSAHTSVEGMTQSINNISFPADPVSPIFFQPMILIIAGTQKHFLYSVGGKERK